MLGLCAGVLCDKFLSSKTSKYVVVDLGFSGEKMLIGRLPTECFMVDQHISWPTCCMRWFI